MFIAPQLGSPGDYTPVEGRLDFQVRDKVGDVRCINFTIFDDGSDEPVNKEFSVILADPSGLEDIIIHKPQTINVMIADCKLFIRKFLLQYFYKLATTLLHYNSHNIISLLSQQFLLCLPPHL